MPRSKFTVKDIVESGVLRNHHAVKKWGARNYGLPIIDFDILIGLYHYDFFTYEDFRGEEYIHRWSKNRFNEMRDEGWIVIHTEHGGRRGGKAKYKLSRKAKTAVERTIRIMLGIEEFPMNPTNPFYKGETYTDKVFITTMDRINKQYREKNGKGK